ncbi:MAG TPA: acyl-[acyl-carrier-protein]--UDP-N-acetylglucosamine O-acyltransferase [Cyanobacteria bacterium UBA11372]|nr:acyl-[acyl-carrier-protein]--UDP-N-acetylglucosamine O-acyltransferase [Cyanobacteria bacterium UBA11372]
MKTLIHPTAVIHPGAELHPTVQVGAYAVIGEKVKVGAGTIIGAHVVIDGDTEIGECNQIFPGAAIGLEPQDLKYDGSPTRVIIGNGNKIREYVTINRATREPEATLIGNNNLLMAYSHVAHNCTIEDSVIITNSVALAGHVYIESKAVIGGVLGIHQFVRIGRLAMVGGMSRIDRDVPPYMLVEGNPSRVRSLNQVGLKRAGIAELDEGQVFQTLKKAFRILYRSGLSFNQALEQLELLPASEQLQHLHHFLQLSQTKGRRGLIPGRRLGRGGDE